MSNYPLVSIIIPAYNMERFVSDAIVSCLNQTYKNREIIVIDDGSIDGTGHVVKKLGQGVSYYYQQNAGVSAARNHGIRQAKGDYLSFLDADDIWLPDKLEKQIATINDNPTIKAISCGYAIMDESGTIAMAGISRANYKNREEQYKAISISQIIPSSSSGLLVERQCIQKAGLFDEALFIGEDWDMWLRISENEQIHFLKQVLVILRSRKKKDPVRSLDNERLQVEKIIVKSVKKRYQNKAYAALYSRLGSSYLSANSIDLSIKYLTLSIKKRPLQIYPIDFINRYKYPPTSRYYRLIKALIEKYVKDPTKI